MSLHSGQEGAAQIEKCRRRGERVPKMGPELSEVTFDFSSDLFHRLDPRRRTNTTYRQTHGNRGAPRAGFRRPVSVDPLPKRPISCKKEYVPPF